MSNWLIASSPLAEALSYWATTGGILIAVSAGGGAYWKHFKDRKDREWDRAREVYGRFHEFSLHNPQFFPGWWETRDQKDRKLLNQYYWYIGYFLWSCEEILINHEQNDEWRYALKVTIQDHIDYFMSDEFQREILAYYLPVRNLIAEAISEQNTLPFDQPKTPEHFTTPPDRSD